MRTKTYEEEKERQKQYHEIYRLRVVEGLWYHVSKKN